MAEYNIGIPNMVSQRYARPQTGLKIMHDALGTTPFFWLSKNWWFNTTFKPYDDESHRHIKGYVTTGCILPTQKIWPRAKRAEPVDEGDQ